MNKTELIAQIAAEAGITKSEASKALDVVLRSISSTLAQGNKVTLVGFGTFKVSERAERLGRNPRTGATIKIKASKRASFSPGTALKTAVSGGSTGGGGPGKKQ